MTDGPKMMVPDPGMSEIDLAALRTLNGEEVEGIRAGAGLWMAAAWLKSNGYAEGAYSITQRGRDYLARLDGRSR
jgi:broad specificity phosphatase PhoE